MKLNQFMLNTFVYEDEKHNHGFMASSVSHWFSVGSNPGRYTGSSVILSIF